jgi:hypothetical protein
LREEASGSPPPRAPRRRRREPRAKRRLRGTPKGAKTLLAYSRSLLLRRERRRRSFATKSEEALRDACRLRRARATDRLVKAESRRRFRLGTNARAGGSPSDATREPPGARGRTKTKKNASRDASRRSSPRGFRTSSFRGDAYHANADDDARRRRAPVSETAARFCPETAAARDASRRRERRQCLDDERRRVVS